MTAKSTRPWPHPFAASQSDDGTRRSVTLRPALASQPSDLRLCEAVNRVLGSLGHPNIAPVEAAARDDQGQLVLHYDADDLTPLGPLLGALPPRRVAKILARASEALDSAHGLAVIHGALTASAVRVSSDARQGDVKLCDFGLGHLFGVEATFDGDVEWLPYSPEKQQGLEPTPEEDVYLLGTLGYAMLAGRPLFDGASHQDILEQHATASPAERLEEQQCPAWLRSVLLRCLCKDPGERFSSPSDVASALRKHVADGPALPPPPSVGPTRMAPPSPPSTLELPVPKTPVGTFTPPAPNSETEPLDLSEAVVAVAPPAPPAPPKQRQLNVPSSDAARDSEQSKEPEPETPSEPDERPLSPDPTEQSVRADSSDAPPTDEDDDSADTNAGDADDPMPESEPDAYDGEALSSPVDHVEPPTLDASNREPETGSRRVWIAVALLVCALGVGAAAWTRAGDDVQAGDRTANATRTRTARVGAPSSASPAPEHDAAREPTDADADAALEVARVDVGQPPSPDIDVAPLPPEDSQPLAGAESPGDTDQPPPEEMVADDEALAPEVADEAPEPEADRHAEAAGYVAEAKKAQRRGQTGRALTLYRRALAAEPNLASAAHALGALYFNRRDYRSAIRYEKRAVQSAPRKSAYRLALGDYYFKAGNTSAAQKHWKKAARLGSKLAKTRLAED